MKIQTTYQINSSKLAIVLAATMAVGASLPLMARADGNSVRQQKPQRHSPVVQSYVSAPQRIVVSGAAPKAEQPRDAGYFVQSATAEATGAAEGQTVNRATNDLN